MKKFFDRVERLHSDMIVAWREKMLSMFSKDFSVFVYGMGEVLNKAKKDGNYDLVRSVLDTLYGSDMVTYALTICELGNVMSSIDKLGGSVSSVDKLGKGMDEMYDRGYTDEDMYFDDYYDEQLDLRDLK